MATVRQTRLTNNLFHTSKTPSPTARYLDPGEWLEDQPGGFGTTNKAYGPYESMQLLNRDIEGARLNIENYVWYALVSHSPTHVMS